MREQRDYNEIQRFIHQEAYSSPESAKAERSAGILRGMRRVQAALTFYAGTIAIVLKYRRKALQGKMDMNTWLTSSLECMGQVEACGGRIIIEGREHMTPLDTPAVLVGNHMSTAETFFLPGLILPWGPLTFVVKESLTTMPFFGPIMRATNPISVSRSNSRHDLKLVMEQGAKYLSQGVSVCIFPQSTRSQFFDPSQFNSLGTKLAQRAGVPIIPFAVKTDFWSSGRLMKDFGYIYPERPVRIRFAPPILPDTPAKEAQQRIIRHISSSLEEWQQKDCTDHVHRP